MQTSGTETETGRWGGRGRGRQRSQLKRAKNLCACAIDRTRLMEQLGLRGDPLLPYLPLLSPLSCLLSTYFNSSFNFQLGQLSLQVFARCGLLRIFCQIKLTAAPTLTLFWPASLPSLPFSAAILSWLNLFNLLRRRRRLLKASATHNNFSHSVGDAARSPQLASNNSNNNKNEATTTTTTGYWLTYPKSAFIKAPKRAACSGWGDALMNEKAPLALASTTAA